MLYCFMLYYYLLNIDREREGEGWRVGRGEGEREDEERERKREGRMDREGEDRGEGGRERGGEGGRERKRCQLGRYLSQVNRYIILIDMISIPNFRKDVSAAKKRYQYKKERYLCNCLKYFSSKGAVRSN